MRAREGTLRSALQATGLTRLGGPRNGFRYRRASGRPATRAERERIAALRIPPAWRDVTIAASARARVQAMGRDPAGRWQYLYLSAHAARRARAKFDSLPAFARALPKLRTALRRDLARDGLPREKAAAAAVLLISAVALRPGAEVYARDHGTFGLATLRPRHVAVRGDSLTLSFRGKRGVPQRHALRDRRLARIVRAMLRLPGAEVFKFRDACGDVVDLRRAHVNAYVKRAMGARFSARDFRTWFATLTCAAALKERGSDPVRSEWIVGRALRDTSRLLGNTPFVVRDSYVHPAVLTAYRAGRVVNIAQKNVQSGNVATPVGLRPSERSLLALLERESRRLGGSQRVAAVK